MSAYTSQPQYQPGLPAYPGQPQYQPGVANYTDHPQVVYQTVVQNPSFGTIPTHAMCQFCQLQIVTKTTYKTGLLTWLLCGGMVFFG